MIFVMALIALIPATLWLATFGGLGYLIYLEISKSARSESRRNGRVQRWLALLIGIAWNLSIVNHPNSLETRFPSWFEPSLYLGSLLALFALLSKHVPSGRIAITFIFASGCAFGVVVSAIVDSYLFNVDSNLFPFAIVFSWVTMIPFAVIGTSIGWWFRK